MFGFTVAAQGGCQGRQRVRGSHGEYCQGKHSDPAVRPGKQRSESEQLFGLIRRGNSGCQGNSGWDDSSPGVEPLHRMLKPNKFSTYGSDAGSDAGSDSKKYCNSRCAQLYQLRLNRTSPFEAGPIVILLELPHSRYYQLFCWDYLVQA